MSENPYKSPQEVDPAPVSADCGDSTWLAIRKTIATAGVSLGGMIGLLGQLIAFVPGAETSWFGLGAALSLLGLLWPGWRVRAVAAVLFIWLGCLAWDGHQRGNYYREWLRQRGESTAEVGRKMGVEKIKQPNESRHHPTFIFGPFSCGQFSWQISLIAGKKMKTGLPPQVSGLG